MPTTYWLKFGNTPLGYNGKALKTEYAPLQPGSARFEFPAGYTPTTDSGTTPQWEWAQVSSTPNVWDVVFHNTSWAQCRYSNSQLNTDLAAAIALVDADCTGASLVYTNSSIDRGFCENLGITKAGNLYNVSGRIERLFYGCASLESVKTIAGSITSANEAFRDCTSLKTAPSIASGGCTHFQSMFRGCTLLEAVPLYDTASAVNVNSMFQNCTGVKSGALALYNQMAGQATPPSTHAYCFYNCGSGTTTGAAELAQIPSDWK